MPLTVYTESATEAVRHLRSASHFEWYLIPILAFVIYVYVAELEKRNYDAVMAGAFFFGIELLWEMFNALVLRITDSAAMWMATGNTAYLVFVGLTVEIAMMFAVAGVILVKLLPEDRKKKVLGIPNRVFYPVVWALFCVFVEVILNRWGVLVWEHPWWNWPNVWLIVIAYSFGFGMCVAYFDIKSRKIKGIILVSTYALVIICFVVFATVLHWI